MTTSANWRRGLHRLFFLGCAAWAFYILVVTPFQMVQQRTEFAAKAWVLNIDMPEVERKTRDDALRKEATIGAVYSSFFAEEWAIAWIISALALPPLAVYLAILATWRIFTWLRDGFSQQ